MARRVGSATAFRRRATDSVRPCPRRRPDRPRCRSRRGPGTRGTSRSRRTGRGRTAARWPAATSGDAGQPLGGCHTTPPGYRHQRPTASRIGADHVAPGLLDDGERLLPRDVRRGPRPPKKVDVRLGAVRVIPASDGTVQERRPVLGGLRGHLESSGTVPTAPWTASHSARRDRSRCGAGMVRQHLQLGEAGSSGRRPRRRGHAPPASSRPSNISASFGTRACIEGRAATDRSQERSVANEGAAVTHRPSWRRLRLSVNIGIRPILGYY